MSVSSHDSFTRRTPVIQYYILLVNCSVTLNLMEGRIQTGYWRGHSRTPWKSWLVTSQDLTGKYEPGTACACISTKWTSPWDSLETMTWDCRSVSGYQKRRPGSPWDIQQGALYLSAVCMVTEGVSQDIPRKGYPRTPQEVSENVGNTMTLLGSLKSLCIDAFIVPCWPPGICTSACAL